MKKQSTARRDRRVKGKKACQVAVVALMVAYAFGLVGVMAVSPWINGVALVAALTCGGWVWWGRREQETRATTWVEGLALVVAALMVARWLGGAGYEGFALVIVALGWAVSTAKARTALGVVGATLIVEMVSHGLGTAVATQPGIDPVGGWEDVAWGLVALRMGVMVGATGLLWQLVGRREERWRNQQGRQVEEERRRLLEEARRFRLIHAGRSESPMDRQAAQELIVRDAVDAVHHSIYVTLELIHAGLRAHTVILLWYDLRNESLHIKELVSDSDDVVESTLDPAGGVIGGITRQRETIALSDLRSDFRGLAYYRGSQEVTEFMGAPVIEQGHLRGVLCVDRGEGEAFDEREQRILEEAADYVMRAVEHERMVASIERTRFEVGRFYEASRRLNGVLTPAEVHEVALESVDEIAGYDFAALTRYNREDGVHEVLEVRGEGVKSDEEWEGLRFEDNQGLVSMVVANRHFLPVGGRLRQGQGPVLTKGQDFSALKSLMVMPLIAQDRPVGTLIVGHEEPDALGKERREMLEVVSNQVAVTMENAHLYARMEEMAKYDALTGLANRRSFEEKLQEAMARHKRAGRSFGLVLTDIDHFKSVNDTYGHPVGDEVLRHVGKTLTEELREVDVPARYGGEEFVIILEDTDLEGTRQVADRVREAIGALTFQTELGELQCTISMGIAMGPWDSEEPHELVDLADQALYFSKENGRNRVSVYREVIPDAA